MRIVQCNIDLHHLLKRHKTKNSYRTNKFIFRVISFGGFHSDVIKLLSQNSEVFTNSYLQYVKDKQKITLYISFHFRSRFHFENIANLKFEVFTVGDTKIGMLSCWRKVSALDFQLYNHFNYLTIIPRGRVGYEMIDSQRGA